jgi:acetyl esterase/lipase
VDQGTGMLDDDGNLHVGPRIIPVPRSVSEAARKFRAAPVPDPAQPEVSDKEAWRALIAATNGLVDSVADQLLATVPATVTTRTLGGVTVYCATPSALRYRERAHLIIHGGGWVFMGGKYAMAEAATAAAESGCAAFSPVRWNGWNSISSEARIH